MDDLILLEYRCACNHLLFKGIISPGSNLQVKCKNCAKVVSCGSSVETEELVRDRFIFLLGDKAQILDSSISAVRVLGYSIEELRQMSVFDFVSHVDLFDWYKLMDLLNNMPNKFFVSDTNFTTKSGGRVKLRTKFKKHDLIKGSAVVVFYELMDSQVEDIFFQSPNVSLLNLVIEISIDGTILYINDEFFSRFKGKKKVDILGKKIYDFFDEPHDQQFKNDLKLFNSLHKTAIFHQIIFKCENKEEFDLILTPVYYPDNRIKGFKVILKPCL